MFRKIAAVKPLSGLKIEACFTDGKSKIYDVALLQKELPVFSVLTTTPGLFESVHLGAGGYGVVWNSELDLAAEEIYENGV